MIDVLAQLNRGEISFSRMCELINKEFARKEDNAIAYEFHNLETGQWQSWGVGDGW